MQHLVWLLTLANSKFNGLKFKSTIHGICVLCDGLSDECVCMPCKFRTQLYAHKHKVVFKT